MPLTVEKNQFGDLSIHVERGADLSRAADALAGAAEMADRGALLFLTGPASQAALIPKALQLGFRVFSVKGGEVVMRLWTLGGADKMFTGPFTATSAAGVVVDAQNRVLFVKQSYAKEPAPWSLPAGFVDPGETAAECASREVFEETGIAAEVTSLLMLRESPRGDVPYWSTGLQFFFLMRPCDYSDAALKPKIDTDELSAASWVGPDRYTSAEFKDQVWEGWPAVARAAAIAGVIRPPGLESDQTEGAGIGIAPGVPSSTGPVTLYIPSVIDTGLGAPQRLTNILLAQPRAAKLAADPAAAAKPTATLGMLLPEAHHMQPTAAAMNTAPRWLTAATTAVLEGTSDAQRLMRGGRSRAAGAGSLIGRVFTLAAVGAVGCAFGIGLGKRRAERAAAAAAASADE